MSDLAAFLHARLAEDEQMARAAGGRRRGGRRWLQADPDRYPGLVGDDAGDVVADEGSSGDRAAHIARHDPARVLREVVAKRRLLEGHGPDECLVPCCLCGRGEDYPCTTMRLLALPYADHANYREEWKP
jgi:hypothetical protein